MDDMVWQELPQNSMVPVASTAVWKPTQKTMPPTKPTTSRPSSEYFALGRLRVFHRRRSTPGFASLMLVGGSWVERALLREDPLDQVLRVSVGLDGLVIFLSPADLHLHALGELFRQL